MGRGDGLLVAARVLVVAVLLCSILLALTEAIGITEIRADLLSYARDHQVFLPLLIGYMLLLSLPFVPGVTLGFAIMLIFGPQTAPVVWAASTAGLGLAFLFGRLTPARWIGPVLIRLGLRDRLRYLRPSRSYSEADRLHGLFGHHPLAMRLSRWRYVALAALVMLPGNALIGGAGGISLLAGMSRVFHPGLFVLAVGLPMMPLPLAVWISGVDVLPPVALPGD